MRYLNVAAISVPSKADACRRQVAQFVNRIVNRLPRSRAGKRRESLSALPRSTYGFAPPAKANTAGTVSIRTKIQTTKAALNMETSIARIPIYHRLLSRSEVPRACGRERDLNHRIAVCRSKASSRFQQIPAASVLPSQPPAAPLRQGNPQNLTYFGSRLGGQASLPTTTGAIFALALRLGCTTYGCAPPAKADTAGAISIRTRIQTTKAALNMKTSHRIPLS